ncbi:uncharacterized protein LOC121725587 [Aricia agestis]|uniref:uncharacterized protein LOC121725587 n=1 Tax=Aricia agestis TaxID=91739 RepID=UPI001C20B14E|nr:uncharacterized protein LOC121725587 [Aricia agestis]
MLKITAIVSLMLIATWSQAESRRSKKDAAPRDDFDPGSTMWAASLSCDSCGSECASACGTRHFRSCCFNYLRKKRGPDNIKPWHQNPYELRSEGYQRPRPAFSIEDVNDWNNVPNDYKMYPFEDTVENRLQAMYDM